MNKKISAIFLLLIFVAICAIGFVSCKNNGDNKNNNDNNNNSNNNSTVNEYTVTWKNYNGEVLKTDTNVKESTMPAYNGATPTKAGDVNTRYVFAGWSPSVEKVTSNVTYTAQFTEKSINDLVIGVDAIFSEDGKTVTYGFYPQTHVSDEAVIIELNALTSAEANGWYLHNGEYYAKQTAKVYNNEAYEFDDGTPIVNGNEYWFKCEAIVWNVLSANNGTYYLLSSKLLDAHNFYTDYSNRTANGSIVYANNYEQSSIRNWLNNEFFNTAFSSNNACVKLTDVNNGAATTNAATNAYACANTQDKVYLPSYSDYLNSNYGFDTNAADTSSTRECKTTDYARAQGAWCNATNDLKYNGSYWTRSATSEYYYCAWNVNSAGFLSAYAVDGDSHCVRPCITVCI